MTDQDGFKKLVNSLWDSFWSGGVANPLSVIEQITYLLFMRRLEEIDTANTLQYKYSKTFTWTPIFEGGKRLDPDDAKSPMLDQLTWSSIRDNGTAEQKLEMMDKAFVLLRQLAKTRDGFGYMADARLGFSSPNLLTKAIDGVDRLPMHGDEKGDMYEYMLSKIASAGTNGQFRTPRHIIELMVALTAPKPDEKICDPAAGTCGFLMSAANYVVAQHPEVLTDAALKDHFDSEMFTGYEFDPTMLRIGSMNMILHGVEGANVVDRDSLTWTTEDGVADKGKFDLILANPPFAGSLDAEHTANHLKSVVTTKKTVKGGAKPGQGAEQN